MCAGLRAQKKKLRQGLPELPESYQTVLIKDISGICLIRFAKMNTGLFSAVRYFDSFSGWSDAVNTGKGEQCII